MGDSRVRRVRWRAFRVLSSSFRARDLEAVVMAFEVGSMWIGRRVKVSASSMMAVAVTDKMYLFFE